MLRGPFSRLWMKSISSHPVLQTSTRTMSSTAKQVPKVAILDDYLSTSKPHFSHIPSSKVSITTFPNTLPPYNHASTTPDQKAALVDRLRPFDVISTMRERTPFPSELIKQLPNLKVLLCTGTQFQEFALSTAKAQGIKIATAPGRGRTDQPDKPPTTRDIKKGGAHSTTQHTWALILALARNVALDDRTIKNGGWQSDLTFNLLGRTLGIVGLGRLGSATARIGVLAWGMRVVCWSENLTQEKADSWAKEVGLPIENELGEKSFRCVSKEELFTTSDVVSVHYVLSPRSRGIIGKKELSAMKKTALFVNSSRGPLVNEEALLETLENGAIRGAALDVYDIEPLPRDSQWRSSHWGTDGKSSHLLTTPHTGYVEDEQINAWYAETAENLERWLDDQDLLNPL